MSLEKIEKVDLIEVIENGNVQVRTKIMITENGQEISSKFHRHIVHPGDDYSNEDVRVQSICQVTHTPELVAAYKESLESSKMRMGA